MHKVFVIHWNEEELKNITASIKKAGYNVTGHWSTETVADFRNNLPDILVISLERLPSHGRRYAEWMWEAKKRQHIPIIFAGGKPEKTEPVKTKFPNAHFCSMPDLVKNLSLAVKS